MGRLEFGALRDAWKGEAADFTPLLAEQLDQIGEAIGVDLAPVGEAEVATTGGRRIDIVATGTEGGAELEFVVENQYGKGDHDHLTRGLAYAVARRARGLVVVAEEHRDEFRAVASYLNELAEHDAERGIAVWLVEAKAVRIDGGPWAPLFQVVVEPNAFTATVEQAKQTDRGYASLDQYLDAIDDPPRRAAVEQLVAAWSGPGRKHRTYGNYLVLEAAGPSVNGYRAVVRIYDDGIVQLPLRAYAGGNTGVPIAVLLSDDFRAAAEAALEITVTGSTARTAPGWLNPERTPRLLDLCGQVAAAYAAEMKD